MSIPASDPGPRNTAEAMFWTTTPPAAEQLPERPDARPDRRPVVEMLLGLAVVAFGVLAMVFRERASHHTSYVYVSPFVFGGAAFLRGLLRVVFGSD